MKIYQIVENYNKGFHAGSKATQDAVSIFSEFQATEVPVKVMTDSQGIFGKLVRQFSFFKDWLRAYRMIEDGSILLLQNPFRIRQLGRFQILMRLKQKKQVRIISLIHDVELLRYENRNSIAEFNETLAIADQLIVHNEAMIKWFIDQGVEKNRLISLDIFDYLSDKPSTLPITYSKRVIVAGNLSKDKSPYIQELYKIKDIHFDLMGVNYQPYTEASNIQYHGAFPPDEVPYQLNSGFGLVWDGPSVETCADETGEYLRYNNPHKLSLYLSSGLPVIIWSEAAEAQFVELYQVGLTVSSLFDLNDRLNQVTQEEYQSMVENTRRIKSRLQGGEYLKDALEIALQRLG